MTKKKLLIKDLSARLPYHVIVEYRGSKVDFSEYHRSLKWENCEPYLRPMSSMTEDEKTLLKDEVLPKGADIDSIGDLVLGEPIYGANTVLCDYVDWLNEHHFDYRGLIGKGLAIEAPEELYKK